MHTRPQEAPGLARCLQLNILALAFSLTHVIADYALITTLAGSDALGAPWYLALAAAAYGWWGWALAQAAAGHRSALYSLLALSGVWAGLLNGGSLVFTTPTIVLADIIHFGSLVFGGLAAYTTWRMLRVYGRNFRIATPAPRHDKPGPAPVQASGVPNELMAG
jgi:hypothetical protein